MNQAPGVDWAPALAVLAAGLVLGTLVVWRVLAAKRASGPGVAGEPLAAGDVRSPLLSRDLTGQREALLHQLRELEDTGSKRTAEQLARERYALELEAARVVLALEERGEPVGPASTVAAVPHTASTPSGMRGFLWGVGTASALGLLGFLVWQGSRPRPEGGSLTGEIPGPGAPMGAPQPSGDAEEAAMRARAEKDPGDIEAQLELAQSGLARQDMMAVWNATKAILEKQPGHPQALSYQALVRLAMGQADKALEMLQQAIKTDPNLIDGYLHLALVHVRLGELAKADAAIAEAARRFPDQAQALQRLLAEMKQSRDEAPEVASGDADPHQGLGPPGAEGGAPAPAAAKVPERAKGGGARVAGTVELAPALQSAVSPKAVLFVFVREAGFGAGPPVAARRLAASSFPVAFELSEADAMMGQPFPDTLLVEARLDEDGDPTTRPPTDPKARVDDVKAGRTDVRLQLTRPQ